MNGQIQGWLHTILIGVLCYEVQLLHTARYKLLGFLKDALP